MPQTGLFFGKGVGASGSPLPGYIPYSIQTVPGGESVYTYNQEAYPDPYDPSLRPANYKPRSGDPYEAWLNSLKKQYATSAIPANLPGSVRESLTGSAYAPGSAGGTLQEANAANEARYAEVLGIYDKMAENAAMLGKFQNEKIGRESIQAKASDTQNLISRGLYNSTTALNLDRARDQDSRFASMALGEDLLRYRNEIMQGKAGVIERRSDVGPDLNALNALEQAAAAAKQASLSSAYGTPRQSLSAASGSSSLGASISTASGRAKSYYESLSPEQKAQYDFESNQAAAAKKREADQKSQFLTYKASASKIRVGPNGYIDRDSPYWNEAKALYDNYWKNPNAK